MTHPTEHEAIVAIARATLDKNTGLNLFLVDQLKQVPLHPSMPLSYLYLFRLPSEEEKPWSQDMKTMYRILREHTNAQTIRWFHETISSTAVSLVRAYHNRHHPYKEKDGQITSWRDLMTFPSENRSATVDDLIHALEEIHPEDLRREKRVQLSFLVELFLDR